MTVKIDRDEIYCWMCGTKFDWKKNNSCFRLAWHCKICPKCSFGAKDILDKYEYEFIAMTGCCEIAVAGMDYKSDSDYFRLVEYGYEHRYYKDDERKRFVIPQGAYSDIYPKINLGELV